MRFLLSALFVVAATSAIAQVPYPAVIYQNGAPVGVGYGPAGGQTVTSTVGRAKYEPLRIALSNGNPSFVLQAINSSSPLPANCSIHRAEIKAGGVSKAAGGVINLPGSFLNEVMFPACDNNYLTPDNLQAAFKVSAVDKAGNKDITPAEAALIKSSSPWALGAYRLDVAGLDTSQATLDPYVWKMASLGDVDGDGQEDFAPDLGTITFRVPWNGVGLNPGEVTTFRARYASNGGIVILLDGIMVITSGEPDDIFQSPTLGGLFRYSGVVTSIHASIGI